MADAGIGRGNGNRPLDMRLLHNLDVDDESPQLEFVVDDDFEELPPAERKHKKMPQHELEDKIKRFKTHLVSLHLPDKGNSLRKSLFEFEQELRIRNIEKKRHEASQKKAKADEKQPLVKVAPTKAPETKLASKHHGSNGVVEEPERRVIRTRAITLKKMVETLSSKADENANRGCTRSGSPYSEEIDFANPARGKGPPLPLRPSIAEDSFYDRVKNKTRANSGEQAGPSSRQGLRSGQLKPCNGCNRMVSPTNLHSIGTGVDCEVYCPSCSHDQKFFPLNGSHMHSSKHGQLSNSSESSDDDSLKKSNGAKRRRHSPNTEEPAGPVVEIFSSDEDDNDTGDMSAVFKPLHIDQQKGYALRSTNARRMEDFKLAYPSREDPEAVEVEYQDLGRLAPLEFLNDTIIDFYIKYMQRPEFLSSEQKKRFHFFNSFFYKKLYETANPQSKKHGADLSKLRKWTKGTNVFEKDYLFVPIHDKFHWSLAIICHPGAKNEDSESERCILHLDSMNPGHKSAGVFRLLKMYMVAEWAHQAEEDGNGGPRQGISMEFTTKKVQVPQQDNESDCGLFLLHYIQCFLQEAPARFKLSDLESSNLFGRNWFRPSKASQLRQEILDLLERLFEERGAQDSRNKEPIENMAVCYQHSADSPNVNLQVCGHDFDNFGRAPEDTQFLQRATEHPEYAHSPGQSSTEYVSVESSPSPDEPTHYGSELGDRSGYMSNELYPGDSTLPRPTDAASSEKAAFDSEPEPPLFITDESLQVYVELGDVKKIDDDWELKKTDR
ncbi:hypothetical protein Mapa_010386 [Marchantia paleacea]|nr:hypothetical protein Mapa_010386 [Marchantia paleacea]